MIDPATMGAIAQGVGALGQGIGTALGGPFTGGASGAASNGNQMNGAGWVVNLGGTQVASASPTNTNATMPQPVSGPGGVAGLSGQADMTTIGLVALGLFAVYRFARRK